MIEIDDTVFESLLSAPEKLKNAKNIMCSISGGSDSDIIIDILSKSIDISKVHFIYCDTGIEYKATKRHLDYLEEIYNIHIERIRPEKTIPIVCREYGQPFLSKHVSEMISRLQRHGFAWVDAPYDDLIQKYPKCSSALKWWCNAYDDTSKFNIRRNNWLKEFMLANPPDFAISNKCCHYTKKKVANDYKREHGIDLSITGMRKAEGGARASAYKSCFTEKEGCSEYRPLWWYTDENKRHYEEEFGIHHSDCYTVYGMKRTGCAGCPFGKHLDQEREIIKEFEPQLYKATDKIFGKTYDYTRRYRDFVKEMNTEKVREGLKRDIYC